MSSGLRFAELLQEGESAPVDGWGFDWFDGRATEERAPWRYLVRMSSRMAAVESALDVQTGGGEVLAEIDRPPDLLVATEGWPPNVLLAKRNLRAVGAVLVQASDAGPLPFRDATFSLVVARHPTVTPWPEIARVLTAGGTFLSQQVGPASLRELTEALMGPQPPSDRRSLRRAIEQATAVGLEVTDQQEARLRTVFYDIAAVVAFLRKVVWIVPGFEVGAYRDALRRLHDRIETEGHFTAHATRFLIEARNSSRR